MKNPYNNDEFLDFISIKCNRCQWICAWLKKHGINYAVLPTGKLNHIYVNFPSKFYDKRRIIKTVLVHYDRIGLGANDNSAAVYQCLHWALKLNSDEKLAPHNVRIIFTDGEELGLGTTKDDLGVLSLASLFKQKGIVHDDIFAIDSCGRGDTLVVSSSGKNCGNFSFRSKFDKFYKSTLDLVKQSLGEQWTTLPTSYGDNAPFILLGMKALVISVLPRQEAVTFQRALNKNPCLQQKILNHTLTEDEKTEIPETYLMMHSENDCVENLTAESWPLMEKFLSALAKRY